MGESNQDEGFAAVYTSMGPLRAEVVKGLLESAGIPAFLQYESAGRVFGMLLDGMGEVRVMVEKSREQEALALIQEPRDDASP
ncbi:MAG: DUF2007 domain-containing protein [Chloroflexi bacterium]|nr:DUF2007 domain-containing protein [Chloroflexota bacterium]